MIRDVLEDHVLSFSWISGTLFTGFSDNSWPTRAFYLVQWKSCLNHYTCPRSLSRILLASSGCTATADMETPPFLEGQVRELLNTTWFVVSGSEVFTEARKGSRPGDSVADLGFTIAFRHLLAKVSHELHECGVLLQLSWSGERRPFQPDDQVVLEHHIDVLGPVWADDLAVLMSATLRKCYWTMYKGQQASYLIHSYWMVCSQISALQKLSCSWNSVDPRVHHCESRLQWMTFNWQLVRVIYRTRFELLGHIVVWVHGSKSMANLAKRWIARQPLDIPRWQNTRHPFLLTMPCTWIVKFSFFSPWWWVPFFSIRLFGWSPANVMWVLIKINVPGKGTIADQPRINRGPTGGNRGGILFFPMSFVQKMK